MNAPANISALCCLDLEQELLGCALINQSFDAIERLVSAGDFYEPLHSQLFETIASVYAAHGAVSYQLVAASMGSYAGTLLAEGMTTGQYLAKLAAEACLPRDVAAHARLIREFPIVGRSWRPRKPLRWTIYGDPSRLLPPREKRSGPTQLNKMPAVWLLSGAAGQALGSSADDPSRPQHHSLRPTQINEMPPGWLLSGAAGRAWGAGPTTPIERGGSGALADDLIKRRMSAQGKITGEKWPPAE